jgi:hypothetical protein
MLRAFYRVVSVMASSLPPQTSLRLPRLTLQWPELLQVLAREPGVGNPIPAPNDLRICELLAGSPAARLVVRVVDGFRFR